MRGVIGGGQFGVSMVGRAVWKLITRGASSVCRGGKGLAGGLRGCLARLLASVGLIGALRFGVLGGDNLLREMPVRLVGTEQERARGKSGPVWGVAYV